MTKTRFTRCSFFGALLLAAFAAFASLSGASAQAISTTFGAGTGLTERVVQLVALMTVLSLAPAILVMVTSFTRIVVVLSLLRTAIGLQTAPPNAVVALSNIRATAAGSLTSACAVIARPPASSIFCTSSSAALALPL